MGKRERELKAALTLALTQWGIYTGWSANAAANSSTEKKRAIRAGVKAAEVTNIWRTTVE